MGLHDVETPAGGAAAPRDGGHHLQMRVQIQLVPTIACGLDRLEQASRLERLHGALRDTPETFGLRRTCPQHGYELRRAGDEFCTRHGGR